MSLRDYDRKTYIADTARAFTERRIGKREFLRRMSAGRHRLLRLRHHLPRPGPAVRRPHPSRHRPGRGRDAGRRQEVADRGRRARSRAPRSASPPRRRRRRSSPTRSPRTSSPPPPASMSRSRSSRSSRCCRRRRSTCRASSAPTTSTISTSPGWRPSPRTRSTRSRSTSRNTELAMPGFDWDDFSKPLVDGISMYDGKMVGIPFDIPIFILMYRKDLYDKHGIKVPTTMDEYMAAVKAIDGGRARQRHLRHHRPAQVRPLLAQLRLDRLAVVAWRLDLRQGPDVLGRRRRGHRRASNYMLELVKHMPPAATTWTWDGEGQSVSQGTAGHADLLGRVLPGLRRQGQQGRGPDGGGAPAQGEEAAHAGRGRLRRDPAHRPPGRLGPGALGLLARTRTRPGSSCSGSARPT